MAKVNGNEHMLVDELARVLPRGFEFTCHHLSTPPTICEPLCQPPAHQNSRSNSGSYESDLENGEQRARKPLKTYCEKHFLGISNKAPQSPEQVLVLALEIFIYSTSFSTILFVAKADSTGYLGLMKFPEGTPSPIREVTSAFISFLISHRQRNGRQFVVNLFARSQSQYLFPGSVKNKGKHVLDDRGLVKWWCRVLHPLLENPLLTSEEPQVSSSRTWEGIRGYLVVPGLDDYETRLFLPRVPNAATFWTLGHPLEHMSPYCADPNTYGPEIPPRCLVPVFPDDPKARYVVELEEATPEKVKLTNGWRGIRTLNQFWDMMAIRQECSSGRLTGFIWIVFDPFTGNTKIHDKPTILSDASVATSLPKRHATSVNENPTLHSAERSQPVGKDSAPPAPVKPRSKPPKKTKVLTGPIVPRQPRIKTHQRAHFPKETETAHYYWPEEGRGEVVLDEAGYKRAVELLLHLEFATLGAAIAATARWLSEVNIGQAWGLKVVGQRDLPVSLPADTAEVANDLSSMIKRKRSVGDASQGGFHQLGQQEVNTLAADVVRKRAKETVSTTEKDEKPIVNTLAAGLVRKKSKV